MKIKYLFFLTVMVLQFNLAFSQADLAINTSPISWNIKENKNLEVYFEWSNIGYASVTEDYYVAVAVKNKTTGKIYILENILASKIGVTIPHNVNVSYKWNPKLDLSECNDPSSIPTGTYEVVVAVDNNQEISEGGSESNNAYILNGSFSYKQEKQNTTTGISDSEQSEISIYPNPTNGVFKLSLDNTQANSIEIYNALGVLVYNTNEIKLSNEIDITDLENGVYVVVVRTDNKNISSRIIKK